MTQLLLLPCGHERLVVTPSGGQPFGERHSRDRLIAVRACGHVLTVHRSPVLVAVAITRPSCSAVIASSHILSAMVGLPTAKGPSPRDRRGEWVLSQPSHGLVRRLGLWRVCWTPGRLRPAISDFQAVQGWCPWVWGSRGRGFRRFSGTPFRSSGAKRGATRYADLVVFACLRVLVCFLRILFMAVAPVVSAAPHYLIGP
jgi:hypothetical protein